MFVLAVQIRIKPDNVEKFMQALQTNAREARKEPGCRQFDVLVDPNEKTKVMLYEVYNDDKAFEAHQQTPHFKKYLAEAVPLLASRERSVWRRASL
jgi:(4S)-4-hydroxy-5-phosphonooxypentane-2,3-dione isomerase